MFAWSQFGVMAELEGGEMIINASPHLVEHPKRIHAKEWFSLEAQERVRAYGRVGSCNNPHKSHASMKAHTSV